MDDDLFDGMGTYEAKKGGDEAVDSIDDIEIFERRLAGEGGGGLPRNNIQVPKEVAAKTRDGHRPAISRTKSPKPTTWQRPQSENEAAQVISDLDEFERKNGLLENE